MRQGRCSTWVNLKLTYEEHTCSLRLGKDRALLQTFAHARARARARAHTHTHTHMHFEHLSSSLIKPKHLHGYWGFRKIASTSRERNAAGFGE